MTNLFYTHKIIFTSCASNINLYLTHLEQTRHFIQFRFLKPVICKIPSVEENLFTFRLICYLYPGSQKNILTAQYIKYLTSRQYVDLAKIITYIKSHFFSYRRFLNLKRKNLICVFKKATFSRKPFKKSANHALKA